MLLRIHLPWGTPGAAGREDHRRTASPVGLDPALLAFVKCHVTSFGRWEVLRALAEQPGQWAERAGLARELGRTGAELTALLDELRDEGVLEVAGGSDGPRYRLPGGEPSSVLVGRLVEEATRSRELRRVIVAHIVRVAAESA